MSMIFADFVVGPPYMRKQEMPMVSAAEDATWTTFEAFSEEFCFDLPCCEQRCLVFAIHAGFLPFAKVHLSAV